ncbi:E2/UBC family protein [Peribacillus sp. SI8-4]|uniref:E2/UBC family protein n=1 Tax=Peribacillus sp. SI8-4 TaxID=3048009 RepID=UPI002556673B|nr:E2/UBC family protein [Peribacillus sp. SI8-4]
MMTEQQGIVNFGLHDLLSSVRKITDFSNQRGPFQAAFEGQYTIEGKEITLQVALPKRFPVEKPMLFLKDPKVLGFLPHIERDGYICYAHDEGLLLDQSNPSGLVKEAFLRAENTLRNGITGRNEEDYLKEFETLWIRQEKMIRVDSLFSPGDTFGKIITFFDEKSGKTIIVEKLDEETLRYLKTLYKCDVTKDFTSQISIHIPLRKGTKIKPPAYWESWTAKLLRKIVFDNISSSTKKLLHSYLKKTTFNLQGKEYIYISIPVEEGQRIFFGVLLNDFKKMEHKKSAAQKKHGKVKTCYPFPHPLKKVESSFSMTALSIKRHDKHFLLNRTLGHNRLIGKKVTLIGLGSLGSRIAFELARAGVTTMMLIDKDGLDVDNIYRHELGADSLYWKSVDNQYSIISKAEALKMKLLQQYPFLEIDYEAMDVLDLMEEEQNQIMNADLIILALGTPTVELELNKQFHHMTDSPPIIYTWLDPLGIGGHSLLTNNPNKDGCFQCLFTDPEDSSILVSNRASFAAPDQFFGKTLTGCESVFTPYGSLDALQTAILTSRLAIKTLQGEEPGNPLLSWKGEGDEMVSQGKRVSNRYELSSEQLSQTKYLYKVHNCPVCGNG